MLLSYPAGHEIIKQQQQKSQWHASDNVNRNTKSD